MSKKRNGKDRQTAIQTSLNRVLNFERRFPQQTCLEAYVAAESFMIVVRSPCSVITGEADRPAMVFFSSVSVKLPGMVMVVTGSPGRIDDRMAIAMEFITFSIAFEVVLTAACTGFEQFTSTCLVFS